MEFQKFFSIENHYRDEEIYKWLTIYPELENETFVLTEKIHGSNFQLYFSPNEDMKVGKRNSFIEKDENFFDIWTTLERYEREIDILQSYSNHHKQQIIVYGELFGKGVQKEINYGDEKQIQIFNMKINGRWISFEEMKLILLKNGMCNLIIQQFDNIIKGLNNAINFDINELCSWYSPTYDKPEGIVIKPLNKVFEHNGQVFEIKKKFSKFSERKAKQPKESISNNTLNLKLNFKKYVTDQRLNNIFSKEGFIQDIKEIGKYIQLLMKDAQEDFEKDFDISKLSKKDLKFIYNVGGMGAELIKKHL